MGDPMNPLSQMMGQPVIPQMQQVASTILPQQGIPDMPVQSTIPSITDAPAASDIAIGQDPLAQIDIPTGKMDELINYLSEQIPKAIAMKQGMNDKLIRWEKAYEAEANEARKNWPWPGASNLVVPAIATAVDSVVARIMNVVFGTKDLWIGKPRSAAWAKAAEPLGDFMNWAGKNVMKMYETSWNWVLSMVKFGTGILKLPWEKITRNVIYKDGTGTVVKETVVRHNGPRPYVVPLSDIFFTADMYTNLDIQTCEGVFQRYTKTKKQLQDAAVSKIFLNVEKIFDTPRTTLTDMEMEKNRQVGVEVSQPVDVELYECWVAYDVDGDGVLEECVVDFHLDTRTVLRAVYNFYKHQERPFHIIRNMPRENSPFGIGICQMLEDIQIEQSTIHNLRLDNATLANTRMWKKLRNSQVDSIDIEPGGMVELDNMDDLQNMEMGDTHPTLLSEELHTGSLGEKRTGVSDYTVGRESAAIGSRATATSTLALIQEGNKRFKMTMNDIRVKLADIAHQTIMLYQQFLPNDPVILSMFAEDEQEIIKKFFTLPSEYTRGNVVIDIPAISEEENKDTDKQALVSLMGIMTQFYMSLMQSFQVALSPMAPQQIRDLAITGALDGAKLWRRILEAFNFQDAKDFTPDVAAMLGLAEEQMNGIQGEAANPGIQGVGPTMAPGPGGTGTAGIGMPQSNTGPFVGGNSAGTGTNPLSGV